MTSNWNATARLKNVSFAVVLAALVGSLNQRPTLSADASKSSSKPATADAKSAQKSSTADAKTASKSSTADSKAVSKAAIADVKALSKSTAAEPKSATSEAKAGPKAAPKWGYKLVMKVNYFGRMEWSVSPDGSRLSSPMLAITCRPPLFETHLYNTESKKVKIFSQKAGYDRLGAMMEGGLTSQHSKYKYSPWKREGEELVAGRKCVKFSRVMLNAQQDEHRYAKYLEEYWVSPYFDLPNIDNLMAPLTRLTSREFKMMKGFGMKRIATWQVYRRGVSKPDVDDKLVYLQTLECKKALIDPKVFEMGSNFTPVQDEGEILFSDDGGGFGRF